jgi:hypothetical protein
LALAAVSGGAQSSFPATTVGTAATQQAVTVTARTAGTVDRETIVTLGQSGLDFMLPAAPASTCTVELFDAAGNLLGETLISGTGTGGLAVLVPGNTLPVAGNGNYLDAVQDNVPALNAELYTPTTVVKDGAGNLYIADSDHNRIRMVSAASGQISTVAGTGTASYTGDNGPATGATLTTPSGIALDGAGNLYIADTGNNVIRKVDAVTHVITTVAGNGSGLPGFGGDGSLATSGTVRLDGPQGIAVDAAGDLYVVDTNNQVVREVSASTGDINTVAGEYFGPFGNGIGGYNGDGELATAATLNRPYAVAFDAAGNVLIADTGNNRIREINATTLRISTVAGVGVAGSTGDNGLATAAELNAPTGIALDPAGNLYIGDTQNSRIRKVNAASGYINTLAVSGGEYLLDTDSIANTIAVKGPQGLLVDADGNVFFANTLNMQVWEIESNLAALDFTATPVRQGNVSNAMFQTVENDGNDAAAPLAFASITAGTNVQIDTTIGAGECVTASPLAVDSECTIGVYFAPAATPVLTVNTTEAGTVSAGYTTAPAVNGPNSPLAIVAVGVAEPLNSTTTTVTANPDPSLFGQTVTFTVQVASGTGGAIPTGTVTLFDTFGGVKNALAAGLALSASGAATFTTTTLAVGAHSITATYSGDTTHAASTSTDNGASPWSQIVEEQTAVALTSTANPSQVGQSVTFTATVTALNGGGILPDGSVSFLDGTTTLANVQLTGGVAAYTTSTLANGLHPITAVYSGDAAKEVLGET